MCQAPKPLVEEFPQTLLNAEFYSAAMRSENDSDHDRLNAGRGLFLFKQSDFFFLCCLSARVCPSGCAVVSRRW